MNLKNFGMVLVGLSFIGLLFWRIPLKGEVPFPGDLLAGRFFPWNTVDWAGYPTGVPYKEFIAADAVRQTYPWRQLAIEQLKQGQLPWWNPYAMSGTPLLANLQSASFYPLNLVFWLLEFNLAWIFLVVIQPILAFGFMYLFLQSLNRSQQASLIGGLSFGLSGYLLVWLELNTVGHAALWLPLMLWSLVKSKKSYKYFLVFIFAGISSIFANHIQSSLYALIFASLFFIFNLFTLSLTKHQKLKYFSTFGLSVFVILIITSLQLIPAIQLLSLSPRVGADAQIFNQFLLPWSHLVTFIIPNFLGNPATNNYFGQDYGEFMLYLGLVPIVFGLFSLTAKNKSNTEKFLIVSLLICFLLALKNPIAYLPQILKIPVFESSAPARIIYLIQFLIASLAAFGFDRFDKVNKKSLYLLGGLFGSISILGFIALVRWQLAADLVVQTQAKVSLRNTLFPLIEVSLIGLAFGVYYFKKTKYFLPILLISMLLGYGTFMDKYLPFADWKFFYPQTQIFSYVNQQPGFYRFWGDYTAATTANIWMPDKLYGVEGYDSLYLARYGQLLEFANTNGQTSQAKRSDANLAANQDDVYRQRLQDLLGVKYLLDKTDYPESDWEPDFVRFPQSRYQLIWQEGKFKVYENLNVLPRVMLVPTYMELNSDSEILTNLFDPEIDLRKIVILEQRPTSSVVQKRPPQFDSLNLEELALVGEATISSYTANVIEIKTSSPKEQLLVISDTYHPMWQAYLDGNLVPIMRANYAFRAVLIPPGEHTVVIKYNANLLDHLVANK